MERRRNPGPCWYPWRLASFLIIVAACALVLAAA